MWWKSMLNRLNNTGSILAIVGFVIIILTNLGIRVDSDKVNAIANAVCGILVILGILNDSTSKGMYVPQIKDKLYDEYKNENENDL